LKVIVIDPGHGGRDPGAVGPGGTKEADVNLAIAHLVKSRLERDFTVFMTRQNDETVTLNTRSAFANAKRADLFISIHCNAAANPLANGTETYYISKDGARLAKGIHERLVGLGLKDRGIKQGAYAVLRNTRMPAVLVEVAFISHAAEEIQLGSTRFLTDVADAICEGVYDYFGKEE
jgi:N-acetylmuramoyl-L-alanine amidase